MAAVLLLAASCVGPPEPDKWTTYRCEGGELLLASFDNGIVEVQFQGEEFILHQAETASGFSYQAGEQMLRGKNNEVFWTDEATSIRCITR